LFFTGSFTFLEKLSSFCFLQPLLEDVFPTFRCSFIVDKQVNKQYADAREAEDPARFMRVKIPGYFFSLNLFSVVSP